MIEPNAPIDPLRALLRRPFQLSDFRPHQEMVCRSVWQGYDVLLVMPTGAGKSLCFQLPGLARGGTTLVISPLISLIEDQVAKLSALGLRAERIHSGRDRLQLRDVCRNYLCGQLHFLFIAPERLSVAGFPEMLAKYRPGLIAVDEAHCISEWGHDFRPDYRLIGQHLPLLRPTPVIALTATATIRVQDDIIAQLGLPQPQRIIRGFRRTNIAITAEKRPLSERTERVEALLSEKTARPAIIYVPTRKEADGLAAILAQRFACQPYHAGMETDRREAVQRAFQEERVDVVVATIAFGMGIDKANVRSIIHTALPNTVEGYYQEIGRAGRDGQASRAILLYSRADLRRHEYFLKRDYPDPSHLRYVFEAAQRGPVFPEVLRDMVAMPPDIFTVVIDKLRVHNALHYENGGLLHTQKTDWEASYEQQLNHKKQAMTLIQEFAEQQQQCRMVHLIQHFGDNGDDKPCGICDICAPPAPMNVQRLTRKGFELASQTLSALIEQQGLTIRQLHEKFAADTVGRPEYEQLLEGMARARLIQLKQHTFRSAEGKDIAYYRVHITKTGEQAGMAEIALVRVVRNQPQQRRRRRPL